MKSNKNQIPQQVIHTQVDILNFKCNSNKPSYLSVELTGTNQPEPDRLIFDPLPSSFEYSEEPLPIPPPKSLTPPTHEIGSSFFPNLCFPELCEDTEQEETESPEREIEKESKTDTRDTEEQVEVEMSGHYPHIHHRATTHTMGASGFVNFR